MNISSWVPLLFSGNYNTQQNDCQEDSPNDDKSENIGNQIEWGRLLPNGLPNISSISLTKNKYIFGRDSNCDIRDKDSFISNIHFIIERRINNKDNNITNSKQFEEIISITDKKSSNGTYVNGKKIGKDKVIKLQHHDEIIVKQAKSTQQRKGFIYYHHYHRFNPNIKLHNQEQILKNLTPSFCIVCCLSPADMICDPCGHICLCESCTIQLIHQHNRRTCPICSAKLIKIFKSYNVGMKLEDDSQNNDDS